jgi:hypothetical protein
VLEQARNLVPPPERPSFADGDWRAVERALGLRLPADYKGFIRTYGAGHIKGLVVESPFVWLADGRDVREVWENWASMYQDFAEYGGVEIPYPIFPALNGLLPFGSLADVNFLNWLTAGEPEHWPFVYYDRDDGFCEIKGLSAVEFILEAGTQRSPLLIRTGSAAGFAPPCEFTAYNGKTQQS